MSYLVAYWEPLSHDNRVITHEVDTLDEAKTFANRKRREFCDVIIISKHRVQSLREGSIKEVYVVENFGYYRIYKLVNFILSIFALSCIALIVYLYFKFIKP